ncbi:MAG: EpsI family protein, partial [Verrucomicrobiae bacterium]|nr:EpsI family protein [Verrucomicrobiae bacterium]MDW7979994.1 exosortase-associated EpsI family protein [Verrucomicrobiales bacterium]
KAGQKLGSPGVTTIPIPGERLRVQVKLPEKVLDYRSEEIEQAAIVTNTLPQDTSFGQRLYEAPDGFKLLLNVVLMGLDRTSLHKPEFCLVGAGWRIDASERLSIPVDRPHPYLLPVTRKLVTREDTFAGQKFTRRGIFVYWYVADGAISGDATGLERMFWMAKELLTTGVLQRWAYVTCFAVCAPGEEELTYNRMREFIAAAVPEFQLAAGKPVGRAPGGASRAQ